MKSFKEFLSEAAGRPGKPASGEHPQTQAIIDFIHSYRYQTGSFPSAEDVAFNVHDASVPDLKVNANARTVERIVERMQTKFPGHYGPVGARPIGLSPNKRTLEPAANKNKHSDALKDDAYKLLSSGSSVYEAQLKHIRDAKLRGDSDGSSIPNLSFYQRIKSRINNEKASVKVNNQLSLSARLNIPVERIKQISAAKR